MAFRQPKAPPSPPPPPAPKPIPIETDPSVRQAAIELERKGRGRRGRSSTLFDGAFGNGNYAPANQQQKTTLG